jgi:hypothetical protein
MHLLDTGNMPSIFVETMEDDNNQIPTISSSISAAVLRYPLKEKRHLSPLFCWILQQQGWL